MTKKELQSYPVLKKRIKQNESLLRKLEREAEEVPAIMDKVQASQKEWPYIMAHETVKAPEPKRYTHIQRQIIRCRKEIERQKMEEVELRAKIHTFVGSLENIRDRYIITAVYIEERDQKEVAIDLDLTEGRVSQIISEIIEKLN